MISAGPLRGLAEIISACFAKREKGLRAPLLKDTRKRCARKQSDECLLNGISCQIKSGHPERLYRVQNYSYEKGYIFFTGIFTPLESIILKRGKSFLRDGG